MSFTRLPQDTLPKAVNIKILLKIMFDFFFSFCIKYKIIKIQGFFGKTDQSGCIMPMCIYAVEGSHTLDTRYHSVSFGNILDKKLITTRKWTQPTCTYAAEVIGIHQKLIHLEKGSFNSMFFQENHRYSSIYLIYFQTTPGAFNRN